MPAEPPPQPVPPLGPTPEPPKGPMPRPRPVQHGATALVVLGLSLALAGCPLDKTPNPKAAPAHVNR